jgi:hypothetical protein
VPQILDSLAAPATRWGVLPELNRRAALRMLGVLIDRLVVSRMLVQERSAVRAIARSLRTRSAWM